MWVLVGWMIQRDFNTVAYDVTYQAIETTSQDEEGNDVVTYKAISNQTIVQDGANVVDRKVSIAEPLTFKVGDTVNIITKNNEETAFGYLDESRMELATANAKQLEKDDNRIIRATVAEVKDNQVEITVSWFSILQFFRL